MMLLTKRSIASDGVVSVASMQRRPILAADLRILVARHITDSNASVLDAKLPEGILA